MEEKWRFRFLEMISKLEENNLIELEEAIVGNPATKSELDFIKPYNGTEFGEELLSFYSEMNGLTLRWNTQPSSKEMPIISGSIQLWGVERVFENRTELPPYPGRLDGDESFKPLDFFVAEACAAFILKERADYSPVYFQYFGERAINTHFSFTEYLECLLVSRGFWYWIQSLSKETVENPESIQFLKIAPTLFADFDPTLFVPKH